LAPVIRLELIIMFYAFTSYKNIKLFQMDVKSTFLNEILNEEVFVEQSLNLKKIWFSKLYLQVIQSLLWFEAW